MKNDIGVYGLGVMGKSIALNLCNHDYKVAVYNYENEITTDYINRNSDKTNLFPYLDLKNFVESLEKPRKIILMVTAGDTVDKVIDQLIPYLDKKDIIMDGGNSYYKDSIKRSNHLSNSEIYYLGVGISGGEMGALNGPSIMPSGDLCAYNKVDTILKAISAKADDGMPCCEYIGTHGSGHYVKMVHNGIEYGDIQIICEVYSLLRDGYKLSVCEIQKIFEQWNKGKLKSYLVEITSEILKKKDDLTENYLIDMILDVAGQKGTGKWTCIEALAISSTIPTITASVFARHISAKKSERMLASKMFNLKANELNKISTEEINEIENAMYCAKICCYAQGFDLLKDASNEFGWDLNYGQIAMIWREGCIIKAEFLNEIKKAFDIDKSLNLIMSEIFSENLLVYEKDWRNTIISLIKTGIYAPAIVSTLEYFDGYRCEVTSANLLQAQRDYFGAHTYQRTDKDGKFHTIW